MKNKIILILLVLIIAVGTIIICTNGFNFEYEYGSSKKLDIAFKENYEFSDVDAIIKEVLGENKDYKIKYMDDFKSGITVTTNDITEEQINSLENKLVEKYPSFKTEDNAEESEEQKIVVVTDMPKVNAYDLVKFYIKPISIVSIIVIAFLAIMNRKQGLLRAIGIPVAIIVGIPALYVSAIAILRIPVNEYVVSVGLFVYVMSVVTSAIYPQPKVIK